jgi:hypothetical protein
MEILKNSRAPASGAPHTYDTHWSLRRMRAPRSGGDWGRGPGPWAERGGAALGPAPAAAGPRATAPTHTLPHVADVGGMHSRRSHGLRRFLLAALSCWHCKCKPYRDPKMKKKLKRTPPL